MNLLQTKLQSVNVQRNVFDDLARLFRLNKWEDWYKIPKSELTQHKNALQVLNFYNGDHIKALTSIYPEHNWKRSKFLRETPRTQIGNISKENQRKLFDELAKKLNIKVIPDDWYKINRKILIDEGFGSIIKLHNNSHINALQNIYSEFNWQVWRFSQVPDGFWNVLTNQRKLLNHIYETLQLKHWEEWYQVKPVCYFFLKDLISKKEQLENLKLNSIFDGNISISNMLLSAFPEYNWQPWRFHVVPRGYWDIPKNVEMVLRNISEQLGIQNHEDWYRVSTHQLESLGLTTLLLKYHGIGNLLRKFYPEYNWDSSRFSNSKSIGKAQFNLFSIILELFPTKQIFENYIHPSLIYSNTKVNMELDIFIPELQLALEYQGKQHFESSQLFNSSKKQSENDKEKKKACELHGITLIEIPYWWDQTKESLQKLIPSSFLK